MSEKIDEWVQIDFLTATYVSGIITAGRKGTTQRVKTFAIEYGMDQENLQSIVDESGQVKVVKMNIS